MKLLFTIIMTVLMLQQLLPVDRWLQVNEVTQELLCDEAGEDASLKKTAEGKAVAPFWAAGCSEASYRMSIAVNFSALTATYLSCPLLEQRTPPPDAC